MNQQRPLTDAESARLATFIAATQAAAADWVSEELAPSTEFAAILDRWSDDWLTARIPLLPETGGGIQGNPPHLIVAMESDAVARFAERVFAEVGKKPKAELLPDFVAEFANLIAGRAKALTLGTPDHFRLGTPTPGQPPSGECLIAIINGGFGKVIVALSR